MESLRFSVSDAGSPPVLFDLSIETLVAATESSGEAVVFVVRERDRKALLANEEVRGRWSPCDQQGSRGLTGYFEGATRVALRGKYSEPGRLRSSVARYLSRAPATSVQLLSVSDTLFGDLATSARTNASALALTCGEVLENIFRGSSTEAQKVREKIRRAATVPQFEDQTVLILGPSGAGKEIVAQAIHDLGRGARGGVLVPLNCAAISEKLFEPEVFGIEPRFVNDVDEKIGLWERASIGRGTLFLNEIGELTLEHQAKLLRVLEKGTIRRVGGEEEIPVNARVIADTNRDLAAMVLAGTFREDLYWRLRKIIIRVPDLMERGGDLEELAQFIWREKVTRSPEAQLPPEVIEALRVHGLRGGVRELQGLLTNVYFNFYGEGGPNVRQLLETMRSRGEGPSFAHPAPPAPSYDAASAAPGPLAPLREQVEQFTTCRGRYARLTDSLRKVLRKVAERVAPLATVDARTKSIASFAERVQRDNARFDDLRDLAGARIVVHTEDQIRDVCQVLEGYFEVEGMESMAAEAAPSTPRQGYAALRLVVRLDAARARALSAAFGVNVAREALGLWGEIEVRTVLEHAWAHVSRELGHVDRLPLPSRWHEELRAVAGVLEAVDVAFARIHEGFSAYRTSFPAYLGAETKQRELSILTHVLEVAPDPDVAVRLAKLAISDGDWDRAIDVLRPYADAGHQPALRELGIAFCQKHRDAPRSAEHLQGQRLLERACEAPSRDASAWASLAGAHKRSGRYNQARECYARAHELDPSLPYALAGLLEAELVLNPETDAIAALEPSIRRAIERCREHIEVGVNLPWALYDLGKFLLLLGDRTGGLATIARAVEMTSADHPLRTSIESLERLVVRRSDWPGIEEALAIVALGRAVKFPSQEARSELDRVLRPTGRIESPVVFVAGAPAADAADAADRRAAIDDALRGFDGTIVTRDWLQGWANVVASGIRPSDVTVLADAADETTEVERRVAAALGARVVGELPAAAAAGAGL